MLFLETTNSFLSGKVLPAVLILAGAYLALRLRFFYIAHPVKFVGELKKSGGRDGTSPLKALSMALAGTLGVGNISGVATAITAGGAGAVFWMWVSALAAMSVKYAEVALAVEYREKRDTPDGVRYRGGAYHYMKKGLSPYVGRRGATAVASVFALFLVSNSVLTGNIVQVNAAASVFDDFPKIACGAVIAVTVFAVVAGGARRIGDFTVRVIPFLTVLYVVLSMYIILTNAGRIGQVFSQIFKGAFSFRAAAGGAAYPAPCASG